MCSKEVILRAQDLLTIPCFTFNMYNSWEEGREGGDYMIMLHLYHS